MANVAAQPFYRGDVDNIARLLPFPRHDSVASEFEGHLVVAGGRLNGRRLREVQAQDPLSWEWRSLSPLAEARAGFALAAAAGGLYAIGGEGRSTSRAVEVLPSTEAEWRTAPRLREGRAYHGAATLQGRLYVFGGLAPTGRILASMEVLDENGTSWASAPGMPEARWGFASATDGRHIYVIGGCGRDGGSEPSDSLFIYDGESRRWSVGPRAPQAFTSGRVVPFEGRLHVLSADFGEGVGWRTSKLYFDLRTKQWGGGSAPKHITRSGTVAAAWLGQVLILGGFDAGNRTETDAAQVVRPGGHTLISMVRLPDPPGEKHRYVVREGLVYSLGNDEEFLHIPPGRKRPWDVAVVIGIERYRRLPTVPFAANDAKTMKTLLAGFGVPRDRLRSLEAGAQGLSDFRKIFEEWLPSRARPESRVYVYFAGLAAVSLKNQTRYLLPWDAESEYIESTGYSLEHLIGSLGSLEATEVLVILDTGFSGAGERSVLPRGTRPIVTLKDGRGRAKVSILYAGGMTDSIWSSPSGKGGLFTRALARGAGGSADQDGDHHLTLEELFVFARAQVNKSTEARAQQTPVISSRNADMRLY